MEESQEREQVIIRRKVRRLKNGGSAEIHKSFFNEGSPPVTTGGNPSS
ncbi:hypothetical protein [Segatella copri]|nr:hypothetical protein [Segatella copri]